MNDSKHLSSREIAKFLVEGPSSEFAAHVERCTICQAKVEEAGAPIAAFRSAVIGWSEEQRLVKEGFAGQYRFSSAARRRSGGWLPVVSFSLGMALLLLIFAQAGGWKTRSAHPATVARVSDATLMEQVDTEVSETVPDSMAPLTDLVGWDGEGSSALPAKDRVRGKATAVSSTKELLD